MKTGSIKDSSHSEFKWNLICTGLARSNNVSLPLATCRDRCTTPRTYWMHSRRKARMAVVVYLVILGWLTALTTTRAACLLKAWLSEATCIAVDGQQTNSMRYDILSQSQKWLLWLIENMKEWSVFSPETDFKIHETIHLRNKNRLMVLHKDLDVTNRHCFNLRNNNSNKLNYSVTVFEFKHNDESQKF